MSIMNEKFLKMALAGDVSKMDFVVEEMERRITPAEMKVIEDRLDVVSKRARKLQESNISNKKKKPLMRQYIKEIHNNAEKLSKMRCKYETDKKVDAVMEKFVMPSNSEMLEFFKKKDLVSK